MQLNKYQQPTQWGGFTLQH